MDNEKSDTDSTITTFNTAVAEQPVRPSANIVRKKKNKTKKLG